MMGCFYAFLHTNFIHEYFIPILYTHTLYPDKESHRAHMFVIPGAPRYNQPIFMLV